MNQYAVGQDARLVPCLYDFLFFLFLFFFFSASLCDTPSHGTSIVPNHFVFIHFLDSVDTSTFAARLAHFFAPAITMGFLSHRRRHIEVQPEQKWDFIVSDPRIRPEIRAMID